MTIDEGTIDEGMKFAFIVAAIEESPYWDPMTEEAAEATWDEWIARVRRDAAREALAAAEHRATRAEAQSAIRGRAVAIYQQRAREAEAERDGWRQTALDERGAALDALEQIKARDARIKAVQDLIAQVKRAAAKAA